MDNIFDHFTAYQLRQIFQQKHWPEEFKDAMHQEIAYELLDSWLESVDEETYNERVRGIIENMTSFISGDGIEHFIFGKNGAEIISKKFNIELIEKIPIEIELREDSDNGRPLCEYKKNNNVSKIFLNIAKKIIKKIN